MSLGWKRAVLARDGGCVLDHEHEGPLQAHHVITQQHLRKYGLQSAVWDPRIGVTVCEKAHRRHTTAVERLPRECLPAVVVAYAAELGLDWMIERYYPEKAA